MPLGQVIVRPAGEGDEAAWNGFLAAQGAPTGLAHFSWRRVVSRSYGNEVRYYVAHQGGRVVGVLPGYVAKSFRGRRRFYSLRSGAIVESAAALLAFLEQIRRDAQEDGWLDWTVGHRGERVGSIGATEKKTLVFRLGSTEEDDWSALSQKARNKVRKARKSGISFDSGAQYVDAIYNLYRDNLIRLGVSPHPRKFFHALSFLPPENLIWAVALKEGRVVAGMAVFASAGGAVHDFQSADFAYRNEGPVQLLNWEAISICRNRGIPLLDFGESAEDSPVFKSKVGFGAQPEPLTYYSAKPVGAQATAHNQPKPGAVMRLAGFVKRWAPHAAKAWVFSRIRSRGRIL